MTLSLRTRGVSVAAYSHGDITHLLRRPCPVSSDPLPLTERLRDIAADAGWGAPDIIEAAATIERLTAALERAKSIGHNDDCLLCGFKDGVITEALSDE